MAKVDRMNGRGRHRRGGSVHLGGQGLRGPGQWRSGAVVVAAIGFGLVACTGGSGSDVPTLTETSVLTSTTASSSPTTSETTSTDPTTGPTTSSTDTPDTVLGGAGPSQLDQLGFQLGNAINGVEGRTNVYWGETSRDVEEASFLYDNVENGRSYEVWILFDPPDQRSLVFEFEADSLQLLGTEDSEIGPITLYEAKPGSDSVLAGQAMVLVCDDRIQLRMESYVSPDDARDELIAVATFLDCAVVSD